MNVHDCIAAMWRVVLTTQNKQKRKFPPVGCHQCGSSLYLNLESHDDIYPVTYIQLMKLLCVKDAAKDQSK